jgi:hypothetical protein
MNSRRISLLNVLVLFTLLWLFISALLSFSGGWYFIAGNYPVKEDYKGDRLYFQTIIIGLVPYKNCVMIGANKSGLLLNIFPIFSFAHSPISIPWSDISLHNIATFPLFPDVELKLRKVPWASIKIYQSQKDWMKQKAGDSWPSEQ